MRKRGLEIPGLLLGISPENRIESGVSPAWTSQQKGNTAHVTAKKRINRIFCRLLVNSSPRLF